MTRSDARFVVVLLVIAGTLGGFAGSAITHVMMSDEGERLRLKHALSEAEAAANSCHDDVTQLELRVDQIEAAPPVAVAPPPPAPATTACDEVSCVLNNYQAACCAQYRRPNQTHPDGIPDSLDRSMITTAVAVVKPRIMACGDRMSAHGRVRAHVVIKADGKVSSVSIEQTPDAALGTCVAAALQQLELPRTHAGGTFGYPFVF